MWGRRETLPRMLTNGNARTHHMISICQRQKMDTGTEEYETILLLILMLRRRRRRRAVCGFKRKVWTRFWIQRRSNKGAYSNILRELREEDPEKFRQFHRVRVEDFHEILAMVGTLPLSSHLLYYDLNKITISLKV